MDRMKTFGKYALILIGMYIFSNLLIFIFYNMNYKNITSNNSLPAEITIEKAEARKEQGRIYGYVQNQAENSVNGKYIKVEILNSSNEIIDIQHLRISDLQDNEKKMFKVFFNVDNVKYYNISLVETENS